MLPSLTKRLHCITQRFCSVFPHTIGYTQQQALRFHTAAHRTVFVQTYSNIIATGKAWLCNLQSNTEKKSGNKRAVQAGTFQESGKCFVREHKS